MLVPGAMKHRQAGYSLVEILLAVTLVTLLMVLLTKEISQQWLWWQERQHVVRAQMALRALEEYWDEFRVVPTEQQLKDKRFVGPQFNFTGLTWNVVTVPLGEAGPQPITTCLYAPVVLSVSVSDPSFSGSFLGPGITYEPATHTYTVAKNEQQPIYDDYFAKAPLDGCLFRSEWGQP